MHIYCIRITTNAQTLQGSVEVYNLRKIFVPELPDQVSQKVLCSFFSSLFCYGVAELFCSCRSPVYGRICKFFGDFVYLSSSAHAYLIWHYAFDLSCIVGTVASSFTFQMSWTSCECWLGIVFAGHCHRRLSSLASGVVVLLCLRFSYLRHSFLFIGILFLLAWCHFIFWRTRSYSWVSWVCCRGMGCVR